LGSCITPNQIATLVRLKVPRRDQNNVSYTYPNPTFHLTPYATQAFVPVLTLDQNTVKTKQLDGYA